MIFLLKKINFEFTWLKFADILEPSGKKSDQIKTQKKMLEIINSYKSKHKSKDMKDLTIGMPKDRIITYFDMPDNIDYAKCPQCGKEAKAHEDVKRDFGLRKVGYTTDIQSWCRECRRNKDNEDDNKSTKTIDKELGLFKKED